MIRTRYDYGKSFANIDKLGRIFEMMVAGEFKLNQTQVDKDKPRILEFGLCFKDFGLLKCLKKQANIA